MMNEIQRHEAGIFEDRPYGGHGNVYRWLREHYVYVVNWLGEKHPSWETIASRIAVDGVVGARGAAPTSRSTWKVWQRVCRDVKAENDAREAALMAEAERERERLTGVSARKWRARDIPKDWRPELFDPNLPQGGVPAISKSALDSPVLGPGGLPETPTERILRRLEEQSGRLPMTRR